MLIHFCIFPNEIQSPLHPKTTCIMLKPVPHSHSVLSRVGTKQKHSELEQEYGLSLHLWPSLCFLSGNITGEVIVCSSDPLICFLFFQTSIYSDISNFHLKTSWCLVICRQFIYTCQSYCIKTRYLPCFKQHSTLSYCFNHSPEP